MSDLHSLPLVGHDISFRPYLRARIFSTAAGHWWWEYNTLPTLRHGPFATQPEAMSSALRMLEMC